MTTIPEYAIHPVADMFPRMAEDEFAALTANMKENGWLAGSVIWTHGGRIIDGRNRYMAAKAAGVMPEFREWTGEGSLVQFVVSLNLTRRHLSSSQKAVLALEIVKALETEAKARQAAAAAATNAKLGRGKETLGQKVAQASDADEEGENEDFDAEAAFEEIFGEDAEDDLTLPQKVAEASDADGERGKSAEIAARMVGTNKQYVKDARRIEQVRPDLIDRVRAGEISIGKAKVEAGLILMELPPQIAAMEDNKWYPVDHERRVIVNDSFARLVDDAMQYKSASQVVGSAIKANWQRGAYAGWEVLPAQRKKNDKAEADDDLSYALVIDLEDVSDADDLTLPSIADCFAFVWCAENQITDLIAFMEREGFDYAGCAFAWAILSGLGATRKGDFAGINAELNWSSVRNDHVRNAVEFCWLFKRGDPPVNEANAPVNVIVAAEPKEYDDKDGRFPAEFRRRIEAWIGTILWV